MENTNQTTPPQNQPVQNPVPHAKRNFPAIIVILLLFLLIAFGAYYLGLKNSEINKNLSTKPTNAVITETPIVSITQKTASPTAEPTISPNSNLFSSDKLGISFLYAKLGETGNNSTKVNVREIGNKVYVYVNNIANAKPESGQYVEVFQKNPTDSLEQAIKKQFLSGISENDCFIRISTDKNLPSNFTKATIGYPLPTNTNEQPAFYYGEKCPENYRESNGISYFLADKNNPNKFLYFSIGQYGIGAETSNNSTMWQDTIKFLN